MEATKIGPRVPQVARLPVPRRRPARGDRHALDAVRLVLIGTLATLGLIGLGGVLAELAALGPLPVGGPVPGFP